MKSALFIVALFSGIPSFAATRYIQCSSHSNSDLIIKLEVENGVPTAAFMLNMDWNAMGPEQALKALGGDEFEVVGAEGPSMTLEKGAILRVPAEVLAGKAGDLTYANQPYSCD